MKRREMVRRLGLLPLAGGIAGSSSLHSLLEAAPGAPEAATPVAAPGAGAVSGASPARRAGIYERIGVDPVINCRGTITIIGGSTELPEVVEAMAEASRQYVQMDELAEGVGRRLAEITGAEWGMVSAGAAAGIKHVTAACITGGDPEKLIRIPDLSGLQRTEVIVPRLSRTYYDHAVRNNGVSIVMVETPEELAGAIGERTAMIYMKAENPAPLDLETVARIASARDAGVPVLVDAAAEILTIPNVHLQKGASVVVYSGGKALRGPQCAGLLLGRKDILGGAWQASSPHHGPGRDNKVGREEQMGMLAAVEAWATRDHDAEWRGWLAWLETIADRVAGIPSVRTTVREPAGLGNRSPSMTVAWDPRVLHITGDEVAAEFATTRPRIAIGSGGGGGGGIPGSSPGGGGGAEAIAAAERARAAAAAADSAAGVTSVSISAWMMQPGDGDVVAARLHEILTRERAPRTTGMAAPAGDVRGAWDVSIRFSGGEGEHQLFITGQDGNWLSGSHRSGFSTQDLSGTVEGDQVRLSSSFAAPGDFIPFVFAGTLAGGEISGALHMGEYGRASFTARRREYPDLRMPIPVPSGGRRSGNAW